MLIDSQKSAESCTTDETASQGNTESPEAECRTTEIQVKQNEEVKQNTAQSSRSITNGLNGDDSTKPKTGM